MAIPQVVIVGRPNVGKSSVFNWLAGKRLAIVDPTAGVTRDRVTHLIDIEGRFAELVDTGGMGIEDSDDLTDQVEDQIQTAVDAAQVVLFVVDCRDGPVPLDEAVAKRLRYVTAPVLLVVNKTDTPAMEAEADSFYRFARKMVRVSAKENRGKAELLDAIRERLPKPPDDAAEEAPPEPAMKVAIVGRRNVGKSTLVNTLAQAERMIVSEVPGTTRDSIDVRFDLDGKTFIAIDTPGFRRTKSINTDVEFYSTHRAQRSIRRADVVLLFFDASERISQVDKQLCDYIAQQYKPCMFVVNKWDLIAGTMPTEKWVTYLRDQFRSLWFAPIAFVTGQTGKNVKAMLNHSQMLFRQSLHRVTTGQLNKQLRVALTQNPPPIHLNRRPKIFYATQVAVQPPTVVLFCSDPKAISPQYQRYLLRVFRESLDFGEVPIKLYLRRREHDDKRDEIDAAVGADKGPG
jgi:GTP-binding protein